MVGNGEIVGHRIDIGMVGAVPIVVIEGGSGIDQVAEVDKFLLVLDHQRLVLRHPHTEFDVLIGHPVPGGLGIHHAFGRYVRLAVAGDELDAVAVFEAPGHIVGTSASEEVVLHRSGELRTKVQLGSGSVRSVEGGKGGNARVVAVGKGPLGGREIGRESVKHHLGGVLLLGHTSHVSTAQAADLAQIIIIIAFAHICIGRLHIIAQNTSHELSRAAYRIGIVTLRDGTVIAFTRFGFYRAHNSAHILAVGRINQPCIVRVLHLIASRIILSSHKSTHVGVGTGGTGGNIDTTRVEGFFHVCGVGGQTTHIKRIHGGRHITGIV